MKSNTYPPSVVPRKGIPQVGAYRDRWHRYYWNGEGPLPSATTIAGVIDKPHLFTWGKRRTAEAAVDNVDTLRHETYINGREAGIKYLLSATESDRVDSADFGTYMDELFQQEVQADLLDQDIAGEDEWAFLQGFRNFVEDHDPTFRFMEAMAFNLTNGHAGTFDAIIAFTDGSTALIDYKTGKAVYDETDLQMAGYRYSEFIAAATNKVPMPTIDRVCIVHIRPEQYTGGHERGYKLIDLDITPATYETFLAALRLYHWKKEREAKRKKENAA